MKIKILNFNTKLDTDVKWTDREELSYWVVSSQAHDWEHVNTAPWYSWNRTYFQLRKAHFLGIFHSDFQCPYKQKDAFPSCNTDFLGITIHHCLWQNERFIENIHRISEVFLSMKDEFTDIPISLSLIFNYSPLSAYQPSENTTNVAKLRIEICWYFGELEKEMLLIWARR